MATRKITPEDQAAGRVDLKTVQTAVQAGAAPEATVKSATDSGQPAASASHGTEGPDKVLDLVTATTGNAGAESNQAAGQALDSHEGAAAIQDGKSKAATNEGGPVTSGETASNGAFPDISEAAQAFARVVPEKRRYLVGSVPTRHEGEVYGVSEPIYLTEKQAKHLDGLVFSDPENSKE